MLTRAPTDGRHVNAARPERPLWLLDIHARRARCVSASNAHACCCGPVPRLRRLVTIIKIQPCKSTAASFDKSHIRTLTIQSLHHTPHHTYHQLPSSPPPLNKPDQILNHPLEGLLLSQSLIFSLQPILQHPTRPPIQHFEREKVVPQLRVGVHTQRLLRGTAQ